MGQPRHVVVIGLGYVGLPLAIMLARSGLKVTGVDINDEILTAIRSGVLPITEREISGIFREESVRSNLSVAPAPVAADAFIISVATPIDERKMIADLSQVESAIESIVPILRPGNLIVIESTVPPLTCRELVAPRIKRAGFEPGQDIYIAHCPERILPGDIFHEIVNNARVIGGMDRTAAELAAEIYGRFVRGKIHLTDEVTAELVKLMENTYRDVNIALANELASVAEGLGVDVVHAISLANEHPRVSILKPGIGTGGHCIPVDPWFIKQVDPKNTRLIYMARMINDAVPEKIAAEVRHVLRKITDPKIVALGVAYKPNTNDKRNSPAIRIIELLRADGYQVTAYDPLVTGMEYPSIPDVAQEADCLLVLVEHDKVLDDLAATIDEVKAAMRNPLIVRFYASPLPKPPTTAQLAYAR